MTEEKKKLGTWQLFGLLLGPLVFGLVAFVPSPLHEIEGFGHRPAYAAAVALLMAIFWFTEALPIAWTACLPLLLFPAFGVFGRGLLRDTAKAAEPFADAYIFLFLGGMAIGAAMEQWNLHRRVALHIMRAIGAEPKRLLLGMLVATASVSLWISNTATAVMMIPIAVALLAQLERASGGAKLQHYGAALTLSVAYACNVGGMGTKIGTATNSIFAGWVSKNLQYDVGFLEFMALGLPFVILFIPIVWMALWRLARHDPHVGGQARDVLDRELSAMGAMSNGERKVAVVFACAALLWISGDLLKPLLTPLVPTFWEGYRFEGKHYEASVALLAALVLIGWGAVNLRALKKVPWSTLLLLGGSFAMASGIDGSGLSKYLAQRLSFANEMSLFGQLVFTAFSTIALSAVASNTATVNLMLNVLPRTMPVLATCALAASCDFALPAGTPPNAIVFGAGYVRLPQMMRVGVTLDLAAGVLLSLYGLIWIRLLF